MKVLRTISRIIVGLVFIFSGFVKAVDPLGSMYKFNDYFAAFHMEWLVPASLVFGVLLCAFEFTLGFAFLFNAKMKIVSWFMLFFMTFFFILTFILALTNPVTDCGCFGDAIVITNWQTFYKNIVLMVLVLIVFFGRKKMKSKYSKGFENSIIGIGLAIVLWVSIYSYRHLPLLDFMPWKVGAIISEKVVPTQEIAEVYLVYKNIQTGEKYEYTAKNLPYQDTVLWKKLEFVEQKKKVIQEYKEAPIHDFIIDDENKEEHNAELINNPKFQFLLVSYDLSKTDKEAFKQMNKFYDNCVKDSIGFAVLCGSDFESIKKFKKAINANYEFFGVDQTSLKSVVRSNPGLVLLKNGIVVDKWHYNDFPEYSDFQEESDRYKRLAIDVKFNNKATK
jgi:uncharacterized membrane protein YphA (DoxX/SURF4 family)